MHAAHKPMAMMSSHRRRVLSHPSDRCQRTVVGDGEEQADGSSPARTDGSTQRNTQTNERLTHRRTPRGQSKQLNRKEKQIQKRKKRFLGAEISQPIITQKIKNR
jgi:hypothetical protein